MKWPLRLILSLWLQVGLLQTCLAISGAVHDDTWQPEYVLFATAEDITINCQQRYSVVFNGTSPGPPLYLTEGKTTWVRVYNHMPDANLTVHWHGLTMRTAPFSDGTPLVAQWPIAPFEYFDYEIHPEVGDAGTYFYHSHIGFSAITAHGMLYVEDAEEPPYEYDDEITLMLGDVYLKTDKVIEDGLTGIPFEWSGEPDSLALNGRTGTASFGNAPDDSCTPEIITVQPDTTYRLRFINGGAIAYIQLAIEAHFDLTIISADGYYTKPAKTDHIQIGNGQRFDALLTTKSLKELGGRDIFWIRYESRGRSTTPGGYALLRYDLSESESEGEDVASNSTAKYRRSADSGEKTFIPPRENPTKSPVKLPTEEELPQWLEYTLESLRPTDFPSLDEVTRTIYITVSQDIIDGAYVNDTVTGSMVWEQNDLTWTETEAEALHYTPYLVQAYMKGMTPDFEAALNNKGWDPSTRAFPANVGEVLDIVWLSNSGPTGGFEYHPMHAHGEHYYDLGSGPGTYNAVLNERHFLNYTPAKRDTTMLNRYATKGQTNTTSGWRAWRIRVTEDNVGAWMMHCHILQHMVMGMQTVWVFGDAASILREIPEPYINGYLDYGGSAYGNDTYDPLVVTYFDD
ncbi:L-ascorbate oxidase [Biscogniauxia sp. FL1348]|nr:L-ascorbate oxidase [Biscogniauxia sp. FL1348]